MASLKELVVYALNLDIYFEPEPVFSLWLTDVDLGVYDGVSSHVALADLAGDELEGAQKAG